jgi:hypothetical protein
MILSPQRPKHIMVAHGHNSIAQQVPRPWDSELGWAGGRFVRPHSGRTDEGKRTGGGAAPCIRGTFSDASKFIDRQSMPALLLNRCEETFSVK